MFLVIFGCSTLLNTYIGIYFHMFMGYYTGIIGNAEYFNNECQD